MKSSNDSSILNSKKSRDDKTLKECLFDDVKAELEKFPTIADKMTQVDLLFEQAFRHDLMVKAFSGERKLEGDETWGKYKAKGVIDVNGVNRAEQNFKNVVSDVGKAIITNLHAPYARSFVTYNYIKSLIEEQEKCQSVLRDMNSLDVSKEEKEKFKPIKDFIGAYQKYLNDLEQYVYLFNDSQKTTDPKNYLEKFVNEIMSIEQAEDYTSGLHNGVKSSMNDDATHQSAMATSMLNRSTQVLYSHQPSHHRQRSYVTVPAQALKEKAQKAIAEAKNMKEALTGSSAPTSLAYLGNKFNFDTCEKLLIAPLENHLKSRQNLSTADKSNMSLQERTLACQKITNQLDAHPGLQSKFYLLPSYLQKIRQRYYQGLRKISNIGKKLGFFVRISRYFHKPPAADAKHRTMSYLRFCRIMRKEKLSIMDPLTSIRFKNFMHEIDPNNIQQLTYNNLKKFVININDSLDARLANPDVLEKLSLEEINDGKLKFEKKGKDIPVPGARSISLEAAVLYYKMLEAEEKLNDSLERGDKGQAYKVMQDLSDLKNLYKREKNKLFDENEEEENELEKIIKEKSSEKMELIDENTKLNREIIFLRADLDLDPKKKKNEISERLTKIKRNSRKIQKLTSELHRANKEFKKHANNFLVGYDRFCKSEIKKMLLNYEKLQFLPILKEDQQNGKLNYVHERWLANLENDKTVDGKHSDKTAFTRMYNSMFESDSYNPYQADDARKANDDQIGNFIEVIKNLSPRRSEKDHDLEGKLETDSKKRFDDYKTDLTERLEAMMGELMRQKNVSNKLLHLVPPSSAEYDVIRASDSYLDALIDKLHQAKGKVSNVLQNALKATSTASEPKQSISPYQESLAEQLTVFSQGFQNSKMIDSFEKKRAIPPEDLLQEAFISIVGDKVSELEGFNLGYKKRWESAPAMAMILNKDPLKKINTIMTSEKLLDLIFQIKSSYFLHGQTVEETVRLQATKEGAEKLQKLLTGVLGHVPIPHISILKDFIGTEFVLNQLQLLLAPVFISTVPSLIGHLRSKIYGLLDVAVTQVLNTRALKYAKAIEKNEAFENADRQAFMTLFAKFNILTQREVDDTERQQNKVSIEQRERELVKAIYKDFKFSYTTEGKKQDKMNVKDMNSLYKAFKQTEGNLQTLTAKAARPTSDKPSNLINLVAALDLTQLGKSKKQKEQDNSMLELQDLIQARIEMQFKSGDKSLIEQAKLAMRELFLKHQNMFVPNYSPLLVNESFASIDPNRNDFRIAEDLGMDSEGEEVLRSFHTSNSLAEARFDFSNKNPQLLELGFRLLIRLEKMYNLAPSGKRDEKSPYSIYEKKIQEKIKEVFESFRSLDSNDEKIKNALINIIDTTIDLKNSRDYPQMAKAFRSLSRDKIARSLQELSELKTDLNGLAAPDLEKELEMNLENAANQHHIELSSSKLSADFTHWKRKAQDIQAAPENGDERPHPK